MLHSGRHITSTQDVGTDDLPRQWDGEHRPLVAFDFDGTLTARDSFQAFLAWRSNPIQLASAAFHLSPSGLSYLQNQNRVALKAAMIRHFLKGISRAQLWTETRQFAAERSRSLLRPDAVACWKRWQARGARLIIVTASPEPLVAPFAHGLGAERVIGTRLDFDDQDCVTGALVGANCRGPEKVARLKAIYGQDMVLEAAYGDSQGDREMLQMASEQGMRVFTSKP